MKERRTTLESRKARGIRLRIRASLPEVLVWIESKLIPAPPSTCLLWTGSSSTHGYGDFRWRGKHYLVHRFLLENALGRDLLPHEQTMHKCDNRLCARLDHLMLGTAKDNTHDMMKKGRQKITPEFLRMQQPGVSKRERRGL